MQRFFLIFLILFCIYRPAFSDITFEGANNEFVILTGFIETEELDEMLAEIKIKKPKQIILDSYGGDTQSARYLAQYIHNNNISTYVSEVAVCKSACVILFLAGKKRLCEGELGVHQGYLPKDEENEKVRFVFDLSNLNVTDAGNIPKIINLVEKYKPYEHKLECIDIVCPKSHTMKRNMIKKCIKMAKIGKPVYLVEKA